MFSELGTNGWIGLSDVETDETWGWEDGTTGNYRNWAADRPDNGTDEDCAYFDANGTWEDVVCTLEQYYACKYCTQALATAGQAMTAEYVTKRAFFSFHTATPLAHSDAKAACVSR